MNWDAFWLAVVVATISSFWGFFLGWLVWGKEQR